MIDLGLSSLGCFLQLVVIVVDIDNNHIVVVVARQKSDEAIDFGGPSAGLVIFAHIAFDVAGVSLLFQFLLVFSFKGKGSPGNDFRARRGSDGFIQIGIVFFQADASDVCGMVVNGSFGGVNLRNLGGLVVDNSPSSRLGIAAVYKGVSAAQEFSVLGGNVVDSIVVDLFSIDGDIAVQDLDVLWLVLWEEFLFVVGLDGTSSPECFIVVGENGVGRITVGDKFGVRVDHSVFPELDQGLELT
mmetsp:Transcript_9819/g.20401  ORF Transcript_9819/g.20401 Transcript_9819/m.20401 type:complete len:243 (+) Transcript_9819:199-927(+)